MKALSDYSTDTKLQDLTDDQQHTIFNLSLYAVNTRELYQNKFSGIQRNLYNKYIKGQYEEEQATKAFLNCVPDVLRFYKKELGEHFRLSQTEKILLAEEIKEHYTMDFELYPQGGLLS